MSSLYPNKTLRGLDFNYTPSYKTNIRDTFRRFSTPQNQEINKPLVPMLPIEGFVLSADWFEILE
jgi:hypothetical protein